MELERLKFWIVVPQVATNYVKKPCAYSLGNTTGYSVTGAGTLSQSTDEDAIYSRRWGRCLKVACTKTADGVEYGKTKGWGIPVTNTKKYTFSVDVIDLVAGENLRLLVKNAGGTVKASLAFKSTGYWQRPSVTVTADATATDWRIEVRREAGQGTGTFYCTGFQFEDGEEATTFFDGYTTGFGYSGYPEFWFEGTRNGSYSHRSNKTRAGGRLLEINTDHRRIIAAEGLGFGAFDSIATPMVTGGEVYQTHIHKSRTIAFVIAYDGKNQGEMQALRDELLSAVRPDYFGDQPMIIRYQGFDANGAEATDPVDIVCVFQPSHESTPPTPVFQKDMLVFKVLDGYFEGAFHEGIELDQYEDFTHADYIMGRDAEEGWFEMAGMTGVCLAVAEAPNGDIYVGGSFTNAGGIAGLNYLAKWSKSNQAWEAVAATSPNNQVNALAFDAKGDLYVGGGFTDFGSANGDGIVKITNLEGTPKINALGTGCNSSVEAIYIDPEGGVYVGGYFTSAGGVANTKRIAKWDGSVWSALGTGFDGSVLAIVIKGHIGSIYKGKFDGLYAGGEFTHTGDGLTDLYRLARWDGSNWHGIGANDLNNMVQTLSILPTGNIVVGGWFTNAGGSEVIPYLAVWNGSNFQRIGTFNNRVNGSCVSRDGTLYVCGRFTSPEEGVFTADRVAQYKNGAWLPLDIDLPGTLSVNCVYETEDRTLYLSGQFTGTAYTGKTAIMISNNSGNANVYPTIQIHGPGTLNAIGNRTTGKSIVFNNLTLLNGEWLNLFLDPVNLRMTSSWSGRGSVLDYVLPGSDYGSFYLTPGVNRVSLFMDVVSPTDCWMMWKPKYWNIERAAHV